MFKKALTQNDWHAYVEDRLSAYIDGQLSDEERANVRKHLQQCESCQASLDSLGWTIKLLKQVPAPPLPRQFTLPVPESPRAPATPDWLKWGLAAASSVAALAFIILLSVNVLSGGATLLPGQRAYAPMAAPTAVAMAQATTAPAGGQSDRSLAATTTPAATLEPPQLAPNVLVAPTQAPAVAETAPLPTEVQPQTGAPIFVPFEGTPTPPSVQSVPPSPSISQGVGGGGFENSTAVPPCTGCGGGGPTTDTQTPKITMAQPATAPTAPTVLAIGQVNTRLSSGRVNVRDVPNGQVLGTLVRGTIVQILGRDATHGWLEIIFPPDNDQGTTGWVATGLIIITSGNIQTLPTLYPPTDTPTPAPSPTVVPDSATPTPEAMTAPTRDGRAIQSSRPTPASTRAKPEPASTAPTATSPPPTPAADLQSFSLNAIATPPPTFTFASPLPAPASPSSAPTFSTTLVLPLSPLTLAAIISLVCAVLFGVAALRLFRA